MSKTRIGIVLDKSSSMGRISKQAVDWYNENVTMFQDKAEKGEDIEVSCWTFNHDVFEHFVNVPAKDAQLATDESFRPSGSTAMRDAIGHAINELKRTDDGECTYLMIVISDGQENVSREFTVEALKEMVEECNKTKRWTFTYLGCDQSYLDEVVRQTSIPKTNMASWKQDAGSVTRARGATRGMVGNYLACKAQGLVLNEDMYGSDGQAADLEKAGGFTNSSISDSVNSGADSEYTVSAAADKTDVFLNARNLSQKIDQDDNEAGNAVQARGAILPKGGDWRGVKRSR